MARFEVVSKYKDSPIDLIPKRATKGSAGYDMVAAEDVTIPPYQERMDHLRHLFGIPEPVTINDMENMSKASGVKPTLVSTGVKCQMDDNQYLQLQVRSSLPLKSWLIMGNGPGVVDSSYYNNESNEGEIFLQLINLSDYPILIPAGTRICQGIILNYATVEGDDATAERTGGFGSTGS